MPGAETLKFKGFKYLCLGNKPQSQQKSRPIKLEFFEETVASFVFQNFRKVLMAQDAASKLKKLMVAPDRTTEQRKQYTRVREEKLAKGEKDLVIRERKENYVIIKSTKNNFNQKRENQEAKRHLRLG